MWRFFFFCFLSLFGPLFSYDEWDDEEGNNFEETSYVTYSGMSFFCTVGCGIPEADPDADEIQYLYSHWLPKPLFREHDSDWEAWYIEDLGLYKWQGNSVDIPSLHSYFYDEEFEESHENFLQISSQFLRDLRADRISDEEMVNRHLKNVRKIGELKTLGDRFIEFEENYEDVNGFEMDYFLKLIPIDQALKEEKKRIQSLSERICNTERYEEYAKETFQLMDSLYRKIFTFCLQHHQPEGIAFQAALSDFLAGDLDDALDQMRYLLNLAEEKGWENELLAKLSFLQGQIENELCLYADAIIDLSRSIQKDPQNKEAYLERARAYFEVGEFEEAFQDFVNSGFQPTPIDPADLDLSAFASGLMTGAYRGALEGAAEFLPSMLTSMKTLGAGLWAYTQDPAGVSVQFTLAALEMMQSIESIQDAASLFIPELRDLVGKWSSLSMQKKRRGMWTYHWKIWDRYSPHFRSCKGS